MLPNKQPIKINSFTIYKSKFIAGGIHSKVYECSDSNNLERKLCAKIILNTSAKIDIEKIKNIEHENLVKVVDILVADNQTIIIMDQFESLKNQMVKKQYSEEESIKIICQIVLGYQYLIDQQLELRDLKPTQILVSQNTYKISNYGLGDLYKNTDNERREYAAPEIYFSKLQTRQKDVFSLGLIFYKLLTNNLPFLQRTNGDILRFLEQLKNQEIDIPVQISDESKKLIQNMIVYDPAQRIEWNNLINNQLLFPKFVRKNQRIASIKINAVETYEEETQY